jgi:hypothetical protein
MRLGSVDAFALKVKVSPAAQALHEVCGQGAAIIPPAAATHHDRVTIGPGAAR